MSQESPLDCTEYAEVGASLGQAEGTVRSPSNDIRVDVVLAIVLPEAHGADLISSATDQGDASAAWARHTDRPLVVDLAILHGSAECMRLRRPV